MDNEIKTKKLNVDNVKNGLRVQINDHGQYQGELGEIISVKEGCSCSDGWCKVLLDKEHHGDFIVDEFRYGRAGDVSDLLQVTKEPPRPKPVVNAKAGEKVTPKTAIIGTNVKIWSGSRFSHQSKLTGKITGRDGSVGWVSVSFPDGSNSYRYGHPDVEGGASDLVLA